MASHNQRTVCYNSIISNSCVIPNVCCERVHLFFCNTINNLALIDIMCCKCCSNDKSWTIPVDLRKKCDSDQGIPFVNTQAASNQVTSRITQRQLDLESSNLENSSSLISLNDVINNATVTDKNYIKPTTVYKLCSKHELSYFSVNKYVAKTCR